MALDPALKTAVRAGYLNGLSLENAAAQAGVGFETARKWKRKAKDAGDDWDRFRAASLLSEGGLEEVLRSALKLAINQSNATFEMIENLKPPEFPGVDADPEQYAAYGEAMARYALQRVQATTSLADALNKMGSLVKRLMPETDALAIQLQTLKAFAAFVATRFPAALPALAEPLEAFGREVSGG